MLRHASPQHLDAWPPRLCVRSPRTFSEGPERVRACICAAQSTRQRPEEMHCVDVRRTECTHELPKRNIKKCGVGWAFCVLLRGSQPHELHEQENEHVTLPLGVVNPRINKAEQKRKTQSSLPWLFGIPRQNARRGPEKRLGPERCTAPGGAEQG